jgi:hypothetical protein
VVGRDNQHTSRAFIFDNSGTSKTWLAKIINGNTIEMQVDEIPNWFRKYVLDKFA